MLAFRAGVRKICRVILITKKNHVIFIFNIQILKYIGDNGIVVYGIISNCIIVGTSLFNGIAQATQPVIATNHGADEVNRVKTVLKYAMYTTIAIGIILFAIIFVFTKKVILVFVKADESIINMGIPSIRMYLSAFCIMIWPMNVMWLFD